MFKITAIVFTVAILLGLFLALRVLANKETPKAIAFLHGGFAATGLILLILSLLMVPVPSKDTAIISLIVFLLAAMGGFFLIYKDLMAPPIPKPVVLMHGLMALIGYSFLLYFIVKQL